MLADHNFLLDFATTHHLISDKWVRSGFGSTTDLHSAYACFFQYLFTPAPAVTQLLAQAGLVSAGGSVTALTPPSVLVCAQLRVGRNSSALSESFSSAAAFVSLNRVWSELRAYLLTRLPALNPTFVPPQNEARRPLSYALFLSTDSEAVLAHARREWRGVDETGSEILRLIPGPLLHFDRLSSHSHNHTASATASAAELRSALQKAAAENYALGLCQFVVSSDNGFGRTGVWRTRVPDVRVRVWVDGQLMPFTEQLFSD